MEKSAAIRTAPIDIADIDLQGIHAHVLSAVTPEGAAALLRPSEFREGPIDKNVERLPSKFFEELAADLVKHNLADKVGLEAKQGQPSKMFEVSHKNSIILLPEKEAVTVIRDITGSYQLQETAWDIVKDQHGKIRSLGAIHCVIVHTNEGYKHFTIPQDVV